MFQSYFSRFLLYYFEIDLYLSDFDEYQQNQSFRSTCKEKWFPLWTHFSFFKLESQNDTLIQLLTKDLSKNICLKYRHLIIMEKLFYKVQEPECVAYLFFFLLLSIQNGGSLAKFCFLSMTWKKEEKKITFNQPIFGYDAINNCQKFVFLIIKNNSILFCANWSKIPAMLKKFPKVFSSLINVSLGRAIMTLVMYWNDE